MARPIEEYANAPEGNVERAAIPNVGVYLQLSTVLTASKATLGIRQVGEGWEIRFDTPSGFVCMSPSRGYPTSSELADALRYFLESMFMLVNQQSSQISDDEWAEPVEVNRPGAGEMD